METCVNMKFKINSSKMNTTIFVWFLVVSSIVALLPVFIQPVEAYSTQTNESYSFTSSTAGFGASTDMKPAMIGGNRYICQNQWTTGASSAIQIWHADANWNRTTLMTSAGFACGDFYVYTFPDKFPNTILICGTTFSYSTPRAGFIAKYDITNNVWTEFETDSQWVTKFINPYSDVWYVIPYLHANGDQANYIWQTTTADLFTASKYTVANSVSMRLALPDFGSPALDMEPRATYFNNRLYVLQYNHKWAWNVSYYTPSTGVWTNVGYSNDGTDTMTVPMLFPFIESNQYAITFSAPDRTGGIFHIYYSYDGTTWSNPVDVPVFSTVYERHCNVFPYGTDKFIVLDIGSMNVQGFLAVYSYTGTLIAKGTNFLSHYLEVAGIIDGNYIVMGGETNADFHNADLKIITISSTTYVVGGHWLTDEPYRMRDTIAQTIGANTGYVINMTIYNSVGTTSGNQVYLPGKVKSDFGDIRFTTADGSTEIPYWRETYTTGVSARFWVRMPDQLSLGNVTFYMYYGNLSWTTTSNASATFDKVLTGAIQELPMDEGSGSTIGDYSGNALTGTLNGANIGFAEGKFGTGLKTTAAGSYVSFGTATALDVNQFTISLWFKPNVLFDGSNWAGLWAARKDDNNRAQLFLDKTDKLLIGSILTSGVQRITVQTANNYWSPTWTHVMMTMGSSESKLYINGDLVDTDATGYSTASIATSYKFLFTDYVGGSGSSDNFNGTIDEFFMFNSAMDYSTAASLALGYAMTSPYNAGTVYIRQKAATEPVNLGWTAEENPFVTLVIGYSGYGTTSPASGTYSNVFIGSTQVITAIPSDGFAFDHWSYNGTTYIATFSTANPLSVVLPENATITPFFYYTGVGPTPTPSPTASPTPTATPVSTTAPTPAPTETTYIVGTSNNTLYFRSDVHTVNNVTANVLASINTNSADSYSNGQTGDYNISLGFRVWLVTAVGSTELTSGTPAGIMQFFSANYSGYYNGYWTASEKSLMLGNNTIKVNTYIMWNSGSWQSIATHISQPIATTKILAQTWQFVIRFDRTYVSATNTTYVYFRFGDTATANSRIEGIGLQEPTPTELQSFKLFSGDLIGFLFGGYAILGSTTIYVFLILIFTGSLYLRHKSSSVILMFLLLFGGPVGIIWLFVPAYAAAFVYVLMAIIATFVLWKVIK